MTSTLNKNSQSLDPFLSQIFNFFLILSLISLPFKPKTIFINHALEPNQTHQNPTESTGFHLKKKKYTQRAFLAMDNLISELKQGRELARQLQVHINAPSSTHENRELLIHKVLSSYERAIDLVKGNLAAASMQQSAGIAAGMSESPRSRSGSPHSEDSDREFKDMGTGDASRKRKSMPRWTKQIQVCPGTGLEGPLDDGFSWRKYGQKDILGAKYPRGYYRCTHRHVQGCLATKQVQRSDEDPTIFEVTYRGTHTCNQVSGSNPTSGPADVPETSKQGNYKQVITQPKQTEHEILINFQRDLKVETKDLDTHHQNFPIFNFPSALPTEHESGPYNFSGNLSPPFMSPSTTTGSNYFSGMQNPYLSEPEFTDLISAATSTTNSPTVGMDFPFSQTGFDPNFTFDNPGYYP